MNVNFTVTAMKAYVKEVMKPYCVPGGSDAHWMVLCIKSLGLSSKEYDIKSHKVLYFNMETNFTQPSKFYLAA